jgi:dTDP-4-dehydrorhamnose 3,5-epimerase-like enzyme
MVGRMSNQEDNFWRGISKKAQGLLSIRNYQGGKLSERLGKSGVEAGQLIEADRAKLEAVWIPGVEVFSRSVFPQRHRGSFGELVRRDEGPLAEIALWPKQWSTARMFAQTAKGFHVHPPSIPKKTKAADWIRRLFVDEPANYGLRRYDEEQWDVMFIVQGVVEMILRDLREGLPTRTMRFVIDGDNRRSANNIGVVIPPGVAHALRTEGSEDVIMVYGTSTVFRPEFEGRIASEVETAPLPASWQQFLTA